MWSITSGQQEGVGRTDRIEEQLEKIQRQAMGVQEYLAEARLLRTVHERNGSGFQMGCFVECITSASFTAEGLTERLRRLVLENCLWEPVRETYGAGIVSLHGISVAYENEVLTVELPGLLPHRKNRYTDYLYKPVHLALKNWCGRRQKEGLEVPLYEQATVCFLHGYDKKLSMARVRDHDNIEEKQMVDALGMFFLVSDGGMYLNTYHASVQGDEDRTVLFLMHQEAFPRWISGMEEAKLISEKEVGERVENPTG